MDENKPIDITSDYIFKGIFGDEVRAKNFLEGVLIGEGKILPVGTLIEKLTYTDKEHIQNILPQDAKKSIFDLQITTNNGIYIIEMQKGSSSDYLKRVEFYNATLYSHQPIRGEGATRMKDYTYAAPIVTISVVQGKMFDNEVPCVSYHAMLETKTHKQYMKAFSYVFIELEKFDNNKYDQANIDNQNERDWLRFMKTQDTVHKYQNEQVNSAIQYVEHVRNHSYTEYIRQWMSEVAAQKEIESAQDRGKAEGKAEGRQERDREIAKNLLTDSLSIERIAKSTGLSIKEIEQISKE